MVRERSNGPSYRVFFGVARTAVGLDHAEAVAAWLRSAFAPEAAALIQGDARLLQARAVGLADPSAP